MGMKDKERRVYSKEFKAEAVAPEGKHEKPVRRVAVDLGVNENMPYRWIRQAWEAGGHRPGALSSARTATGRGAYPPAERKQDATGGGVKLRFARNSKKRSGHLRTGGTPVMVCRFMREHRREYTIRERRV
jgi:transposase-like protein